MDIETITPDAEESAMRELGVQTDAVTGRAESETPPEMPGERPTDSVEASEPETPPQSPEEPAERPESPEIEEIRDHPQQRPRDPSTGKFQKPDTEYSRAVKEKDRQDRSWTALQAEKERIRTEKAQWDETVRMQQLEAARRNYQPLRKDGLTAKEYYDGAKVFEREGDFENAYKAHQVAQEMWQAEQHRGQQMQGVEKEYQWRNQIAEVQKVAPEIWDDNSPMHQHLTRIVQDNPWLYDVPQGFYRAAEFAHMLTQVSKMKELEDELISVKAENEKFRRKSQPARGGYAAPRYGEKDFDEMDLNEQEAHLKAMTAEADNYR